MTIHEPMVEITCDNKFGEYSWCHGSEQFNITATAHGWDERFLQDSVEDAGWIWISESEQYCCQECYEEAQADAIEDDRRAGVDKYGYDTLEEKFL